MLAKEQPKLELARVHADCRDFVETIEALLERRRAEVLRGSLLSADWHYNQWGPRSWHRTELEDMVYSSYKQMRKGRITRPPRREVVMEIADYLNCTLAERNRLLLAAHALPVSPYITGDRLAELLPIARNVAQQLNIPAMVINRDWGIHYTNDRMLEAFAVRPEQLATIRPEQLNVLQLLFDPLLPLQPNLIPYPDSWQRMARQTIYAFKLANMLCQYEPWYQTLIQRLMELPHFPSFWQTVHVDTSFDEDPSAYMQSPAVTVDILLSAPQAGHESARLRPLIISVGYFQFDFPAILAFLPTEEHSTINP